ncbi:MAG: response regulator [Desulfuromonadaceae bacterium]|nr:response regulator [Desulfuromonadaceae bacterium]MDD2847946.1 response regulator [Desulfuromonadaceae bacterium]MDD4131312.1 response regulator [Desulfuromonadaceae bacterium]
MDAKVMLVDDEEMIREAVELFLETEGVDILTVASGDECLARLENGFRGVILMDVMMPDMNGWDTIRKMVERGLYDGNLIVMLTAMDSPDNEMDGIQEYVTDYLTKPFNPEQLLETIQYYFSLLAAVGGVDGE